MATCFDLIADDYRAIDVALDVARLLICKGKPTPEQIEGIGRATHALKQMPSSSPGVNVGYGIVHRVRDEDFGEMFYIEIRISESAFEICIGGSVYEKSVGSDRINEPGWVVELDGDAHRECNLDSLEHRVAEYLSMGAVVEVVDDGEIPSSPEDLDRDDLEIQPDRPAGASRMEPTPSEDKKQMKYDDSIEKLVNAALQSTQGHSIIAAAQSHLLDQVVRNSFNTERAIEVFRISVDNAVWGYCKDLPTARAIYATYKSDGSGFQIARELANKFKEQTLATDQRPARRWMRWLLGA